MAYGVVSTNKQKSRGDLDRQVEKISAFIISQNPQNLKVFKEVGSGLNDNRKQLLQLIDMVCENQVNRIFVLYKDRLTRFGFNYLKTICNKHNVEIVVVSNETDNIMRKVVGETIYDIVNPIEVCSMPYKFSVNF